MQEIIIEATTVGENHPPFNSVELAKQYILQARIAGADAIKFQTYTAGKLAARWAPTYWDSESGLTQYDIFASRSRLGDDDYAELFRYAEEVGIMFLSTPFDENAASLLNDLGMPAFKIASADITHFPMLKHIKQFNKPILLSTGASTFDEIRRTLELLDGVPVGLLHCSLSYPTAIADANLSRIQMLKETFPDVVYGYSDHTQPQDSEITCPLSVGLGARVIEKHYTLNKYLEEDDHYHAVDQGGLERLVKNCRDAFYMLQGVSEITETEQAAREYARRSIVAATALSAGTVLTEDHLDYKRPGTGVSPADADHVLGKTLKHDLEADALILEQDIETS